MYERGGGDTDGGLRTKGYFKHAYIFSNGNWYIRDLKKKIHLPIGRDGVDGEVLPLISIITVVYNGEKFIEETIRSVINQTYPNVEFIIIDGGSSDGTLDIIRKYDHSIDYWMSEKDKGMYDALNKGLHLVTGDIYASLNSDDQYVKDTIGRVVPVFENGEDVVFGSPCFMYEDKNTSCRRIFDLTYYDLLSFGASTLLPQPTTFIRMSLARKVGLFNLKYSVASDYDYLLRAMRLIPRAKYLNHRFTLFRRHGDSLTERAATEMRNETLKIVEEHRRFYRTSLLNTLLLKTKYTILNPVILLNLANRLAHKAIQVWSR